MEEEISNNSMVTQLRKIRDRIDNEIKDMDSEQVVEYFNQKQGLLPKSYWNQTSDLKQENK